jgi:hypothetical protein
LSANTRSVNSFCATQLGTQTIILPVKTAVKTQGVVNMKHGKCRRHNVTALKYNHKGPDSRGADGTWAQTQTLPLRIDMGSYTRFMSTMLELFCFREELLHAFPPSPTSVARQDHAEIGTLPLQGDVDGRVLALSSDHFGR